MNLLTKEAISNCNFSPSDEAIKFEKRLSSIFNYKHRYEPIRLMLGRSLITPTAPEPLNEKHRSSKKTIRGRELFGNNLDLWMSIFLLEGNFTHPVKLIDFRNAIEAHWHRGSMLLFDELEKAKSDPVSFANNLTRFFPYDDVVLNPLNTPIDRPNEIQLRVGKISQAHPNGNDIRFTLNGIGSPHIVLLGKTGMGKTRIGVDLIEQILQLSKVPFIYIDPKPDFAPKCTYHGKFDKYSQSTTLIVGVDPIPLDFLPQSNCSDVAMQAACMRLRDSVCKSTPQASSIQKDRLLKCITMVSNHKKERSMNSIANQYENALAEENLKNDSIYSVLSELNSFKTFSPKIEPKEFFSKSWVLSISPDMPNNYRSLIMQLLLDAESAYWKSEPDSPLHGNYRQLRHMLIIDEAYRILNKNRSDSLVEMITQTRSKGCVLMLISQNPSDFAGGDYEYMTQIGSVISFACSQTDKGLAHLSGIFGRKLQPKEFSENLLTKGLAFCKLPDHKPLIIRAFQ